MAFRLRQHLPRGEGGAGPRAGPSSQGEIRICLKCYRWRATGASSDSPSRLSSKFEESRAVSALVCSAFEDDVAGGGDVADEVDGA